MEEVSKSTTVLIIISLLAIATLFLWGCPQYKVYAASKAGEAELAKADYSKKVQVVEAQAKNESSFLLAGADTVRAHGIARSNEIIGNSLSDNYLKWFFIDGLDKNQNIIYVPTEANIPIMEASRVPMAQQRKRQEVIDSLNN